MTGRHRQAWQGHVAGEDDAGAVQRPTGRVRADRYVRSCVGPRVGRLPLIFTGSRERSILLGVPSTSDFERMLRGAALRVTRPRVAVLSAVHDHPHADTDSIIRVVAGASRRGVPSGRVRRAARLTGAGLLRRIQPSGSVARYESRVGDNHHHVVCRSCGAIADVDCAVGNAPCLTASDDHGFAIDEAEVTYWALCPDCASRTQADRHGRATWRWSRRPGRARPAIRSEQRDEEND